MGSICYSTLLLSLLIQKPTNLVSNSSFLINSSYPMIMEKSRSFPYYSASYSESRFDFEDRAKSFNFNGPDDDPEVKRRKRVAGYNMYSMEGKLKSSFRNSFKWIKSKFSDNYFDN